MDVCIPLRQAGGESRHIPTLCFARCQTPVLTGIREPGCGPSLNFSHPLTTHPMVDLDSDGDRTVFGEMCKVRAGLTPFISLSRLDLSQSPSSLILLRSSVCVHANMLI